MPDVNLPPGFSLIPPSDAPKLPPGFKLREQSTGAAPEQSPSRLERVGRELLAPILGLEQLVGRILPIPSYDRQKGWTSRAAADDAAVRENEAKIAAARGGDKGINWERMGLDVINPVNYLAGGSATALGLAPRALATTIGAASALTEPVTGGGSFWTEKAKQAAEGAVGGKLGEVAAGAVGEAVAPQLSGAEKRLSDLGIRMTPGQMAGGIAKRGEDALSSWPILGSFIRKAQSNTIGDFNIAAMNEGLRSIGATMPKGIEPGRMAVNKMHDILTDAYQQVLPRMTGTIDPQLDSDLKQIERIVFASKMPQDLKDELKGVIDVDVRDKFSKGPITGQEAQDIGTYLDKLTKANGVSENVYRRHLGKAVETIDDSLDAMMQRVNPSLYPQKQAIDEAYAHYKTIERAAGMQGAKDGVFTPAQLSNSIRARDPSKDKGSYARGKAMMQGLAADAERTLPQKVADSGTPERAAWTALLGGGALAHPYVAAGGALGTLPYTNPGLAAARSYVSPGATRRALGVGIGGSGPIAAPAAAHIFEDVGP